jgi:hypothetical protein
MKFIIFVAFAHFSLDIPLVAKFKVVAVSLAGEHG